MKRVISFLLIVVLICGIFPLRTFAAVNDLEAQVSNTYNTARSYAGVSNFNGWCGLLVNWQLVILGINTSYVGGDGNVQFDNYKNLGTSTGGYSISAYPSSGYNLKSALNQITSNGTADAYNILVGFETGYGTDGALYGHTVFIHGIVGGTVYFCESFGLSIGGTYYPEGAVIKCSIDEFCYYYNGWTTLDGLIHFRGNEPVRDAAPVGAFDVATGGINSLYVRGWAFDPDEPDKNVDIHIYLDGVQIGSGVANTQRTDVNEVYGCGDYHGFDITLPISMTATGNHSVKICAINTTTGESNTDLGVKEVTITAHTHSYMSSVTKEATCTESGTKTYTCEICEDTYTEEIPAMGHKYIAEVIDATCTTVGHTAYTCERCDDRYTEMSDGWSGWSTEYPTGIPENLIQQKEQYSTLEKEYTTSTSESLDGWTNYGTTYGDWGTTQTTTTKPTESDILQITNTVQTGWGYYHWCSYYDWTYCIDSIQVNGATQVEWHGYTSSFELPAYTIPDMGGQQSYGGDGNGAAACSRNFYIWFRNYDADVYTYSYQTREKNYQFYRWADEWSDWVDEEVTSNEDRQVKTQTVYRYYIGDLADHNYTYAVTQAPTTTESGVLTGTCTECSDITTNTLPILNTTDYTYSEIKAPSYSETGIGRYTWKTNEYGSFSFDVDLEKLVDINAPQIIVNGSKARPGGIVAVRISLKNNPGIASMRLKVNYDSSVMSLVEVTDLGMIGSQIHSDQFTDPYVLCWANDTVTENFTSNGDIVVLKFKISDSADVGAYDISVSYDYDRYDIHNVQVEKVRFYAINDAVEVVDVLPGDANGDGSIDTLDRLTLSRYLANFNGYTLDQINFAGADVNSDGFIDTLDRLILSRHLANWSGYEDITVPSA